MGDEIPNTMNLDLNLGPFSSPNNETAPGSLSSESVNLEDWIDGRRVSRLRDARLRSGQRWRSVWQPIPSETRNIALELMISSGSAAGGALQTGEGSVSSQERNNEVTKTCENNTTHVENEALGKKEEEEKGNGEDGCFFDCNICFDLARDPVVTCCGHLFCWPCLYRWLHVHSDAKECPVCKGEVTIKNVIPIYGRGNVTHEPEEDPSLKIPSRPNARRVESWRQTIQRNAFTIPMEEMIRRLGSRFDLTRDLVQVQPQNTDSGRNSIERNNSLLNRILTSRGMRREQNTEVPSDDVVDVDLTQNTDSVRNSTEGNNSLLNRILASRGMRREQNPEVPSDDVVDVDLRQRSPTNSEVGESRRFSSRLLRRSHTHRAATISNLTSALSSADGFVESYFRFHHVERNQEQPLPVDDRDSVSSIAAVIHSESQTVDNAVEIDSTVSLSTLSSRRQNDASRVSDVDSGDSRAHRRRRLN